MPDNLTDGQIYVDYRHMENAADDMVQQTRAIANTLSSLEAELSELKKTWYGSDAETYTQKQAAWDEAVRNMEQLLTSHAGLLTDISNNYKYSENSLSQMWSEVTIGR
ncbi:WXG100 family type VII secretion target [Streptomyces sp. NPDC059837]|jgi:WXG100 family type VII secretion target|uniref:WXG100 family type VII secretion target n=1 Tax=unclassified Streptomyces TaxID=2593676 RepID=UPI00225A990D|nr:MULTISPECIES: WXG100 family type VII secretion target [unclassified Streptomyces]MCX4402987.1 WXG100 family type VII secretion target [Streptomyces sp. NBC_01764]MCX4451799.1 WXG100 family type VII secretion target [Streptomyces sp. NBC_01719]MCX4491159.1 WXG100 family type VII secretion target [Streptomyces sp. NBC_01728]MCX5087999.1 WXG100 family type VII secretion target [Streptomyces sp. NBC_00365]MCX5182040.1 WXG100 family type VII secretion target [Streptomyces sp. NBC_00268]